MRKIHQLALTLTLKNRLLFLTNHLQFFLRVDTMLLVLCQFYNLDQTNKTITKQLIREIIFRATRRSSAKLFIEIKIANL